MKDEIHESDIYKFNSYLTENTMPACEIWVLSCSEHGTALSEFRSNLLPPSSE
jgi:hypothetical protein